MEKPDSQGFVNITWPSKTVPHGGIFHSRIVEPSADKEQLLKVLLEESKLTIAQRRKSAYTLRQDDQKPDRQQSMREQMPLVRPRTSRRRSLSTIRESGIFDIEPYCPLKRGEDRERLKEKLANFMEHGEAPVQQLPPAPRPVKVTPKLPTNKEKWNDLVTQIRERTEWLTEMEYLGEAGPHRDIINDQIAERMRALDALNLDECITNRSTDSGFSTVRSREKQMSARSNGSVAKSVSSTHSIKLSKKAGQSSAVRRKPIEENISAYGQLSPLQYSPRRRV
ncbi:UPF0193 protein EVG1 homolog [Galleria mellonella]|uniref:UPF0193 protein EVG1 homolog n=1 Tax=Galleria mellonella TaxID=7137 RepID=A0A6J1X9B7_GALME|nr:UPF0193 protein EVG1 homolog [Galleria mellonella]